MYFFEESEAQQAVRLRAERERARLLSQVERMPDLPPAPERPAGPSCSVCGRSFTHHNQYTVGGTKKKPVYRCRRKACSPRRKRKPLVRNRTAPTAKKALSQRTGPRRTVFNLFGLL